MTTADDYEFGRALGAALTDGRTADSCDPLLIETIGRELRPVFRDMAGVLRDAIAQLSLFDYARATDPRTSHEAITVNEAARAESAIAHVFAVIAHRHRSGLTDDELCAYLPAWHPPTIKTARSRLTKAGRLEDTGYRRLSQRGRAQIVWKLVIPRT